MQSQHVGWQEKHHQPKHENILPDVVPGDGPEYPIHTTNYWFYREEFWSLEYALCLCSAK